ncbi:MAG: hypothetical protein LW847_02120 [Burkholderiales bacterium]|jgi:sarcosine oxidase subunit gamma|nr:hypothetical protein [Burkholderiales bacterium]
MTGVALNDVSARARVGVKGAAAAEFLRAQGLAVPERFNCWTERDGVLVARLGMTEFLVEAGAGCGGFPSPHPLSGGERGLQGPLPPGEGGAERRVREDPALPSQLPTPLQALAAALHAATQLNNPDLYPVLRADCALVLAGPLANDLLVQVCNVDFAPLARAATANDGPLALTQMVGVSVTVVPQRRADDLLYRIWCDPSFGPYLKTTLQDIADELNAGAPTA